MKPIYETTAFETWLEERLPDIEYFSSVVSYKIDPLLDNSAQYVDLSDKLCNIKQDVCDIHNEAEQFYRNWLSRRTGELEKLAGFKGKSPKTILDFAKNENCMQGIVFKRLEAILNTIEFVGSQIQSKLKYYKPPGGG